MAEKRKTVKRALGDILRIDLGAGRHAYAQVAEDPLIIFFEGAFDEDIPVEKIPSLPVAFRLWVAHYAITQGIWPVIALQPLTLENAQEPFFYKQDVISGRLSLHHSSFAATNYERPASLAECDGLECAAVWEPEHVIVRLRDHALGQLNLWVESMRIDPSRIPA